MLNPHRPLCKYEPHLWFRMASFHYCRKNFLRMDVYFAALKYQSVVQTPDYDLQGFLSMYWRFSCILYLLHCEHCCVIMFSPCVSGGCISFGIVCLSVCLALTAKRTDIWNWFSACRSSGRISKSILKVKVIGQRSRSQCKKTFFNDM